MLSIQSSGLTRRAGLNGGSGPYLTRRSISPIVASFSDPETLLCHGSGEALLFLWDMMRVLFWPSMLQQRRGSRLRTTTSL